MCVFIVFCLLCTYNSGPWQRYPTFFFFFAVFTVSVLHKQQAFPLKLMESNANLFGNFKPHHGLLMWFQFTTNESTAETAVLYVHKP